MFFAFFPCTGIVSTIGIVHRSLTIEFTIDEVALIALFGLKEVLSLAIGIIIGPATLVFVAVDVGIATLAVSFLDGLVE